MLEGTGAITNEVIEPIKFVLAYSTLYVCVCVCVCVYVCVCIYICVCVCVCMYVYGTQANAINWPL
jgi:hypothetical protein